MDLYEKITAACKKANFAVGKHCIYVSVCEQKFYLFCDGQLVKTYLCSTSRAPQSCVKDSLGTPWGLHYIVEKIGAGEPLDTVFKGRKNVGSLSDFPLEARERNLIVSRILRLRGLEPGVNLGGNVDTYDRYVYIHGTNRTEMLGSPDSHGCVLLSPSDIAEIFDIANCGDCVLISHP